MTTRQQAGNKATDTGLGIVQPRTLLPPITLCVSVDGRELQAISPWQRSSATLGTNSHPRTTTYTPHNELFKIPKTAPTHTPPTQKKKRSRIQEGLHLANRGWRGVDVPEASMPNGATGVLSAVGESVAVPQGPKDRGRKRL